MLEPAPANHTMPSSHSFELPIGRVKASTGSKSASYNYGAGHANHSKTNRVSQSQRLNVDEILLHPTASRKITSSMSLQAMRWISFRAIIGGAIQVTREYEICTT
jgi:hypothetical protein